LEFKIRKAKARGWEKIKERLKRTNWLRVLLVIFSFTVFMQFIIEEAIQMHSYGAHPVLSNKYISVAEKVKTIDEAKRFHERMELFMDLLGLINPISGAYYEQFMKANEERIDNNYRTIFGMTIEEASQVERECELAEIGQKCRAEGFIFGIKTDKKWTSIVFGKNTMSKNPEYRDAGEENLKGTWIVTRAKTNYSLGELMEIFELKDKPKKGDWIEVVGFKESEEKEINVRLGYLLYLQPKIQISETE